MERGGRGILANPYTNVEAEANAEYSALAEELSAELLAAGGDDASDCRVNLLACQRAIHTLELERE